MFRPTERRLNSYQDPFEEYKTRLAKKLAHRAQAETNPQPTHKAGDDVNWFGVKLGAGAADAILGSNGNEAAGVGKYLNLKRPRDEPMGEKVALGGLETKKRKKIGFGDFEAW